MHASTMNVCRCIQCSYIKLCGCTFKKFVSDNMILFGMTVTFFSKTCRLSFILLKQNININALTSTKLKYSVVFQRQNYGEKVTLLWKSDQACITDFSPRDVPIQRCFVANERCLNGLPRQSQKTYFFIRFSSLNWRQSKINKHTLASLNADFWKKKKTYMENALS